MVEPWDAVIVGVCQADNGYDIDPSIALNDLLGA